MALDIKNGLKKNPYGTIELKKECILRLPNKIIYYGFCGELINDEANEYFFVKDIRLTIDTSIEYDGSSNFLKENLNQTFVKDKACVCEIKCEFNYESNDSN